MKLPALLRAMRPQQWVKNIFVLAAVAFARADLSAPRAPGLGDVYRSLFAFAAFCLGASAIYLVNDVLDVESDRAHPTKRHRPIAAGEVSVALAMIGCVVCVALALTLGWLAGGEPRVVWIVGSYIALNFAYSVKLKHIVLVDAFCIASGFILRVEAGALAAHADVSRWLILCTLFLSLFLALCKRKAEIDLLGEERGSHRANLKQYTAGFLDQMVTVLAACTIVCYTMYTVAEETAEKFGSGNGLVYTVPFVVFGLARYMLLVSQQRGGGNPTRMLLGGDAIFVANALAWVGVTAWVVYG
ncbi:MAG: decaprenyl-phosphate phosphoribosyltransferase [Planctomycetes bacterium]|nr:decaprenyl-phosphate phosphoribosyltransferase [Planctomycetota bacterium]